MIFWASAAARQIRQIGSRHDMCSSSPTGRDRCPCTDSSAGSHPVKLPWGLESALFDGAQVRASDKDLPWWNSVREGLGPLSIRKISPCGVECPIQTVGCCLLWWLPIRTSDKLCPLSSLTCPLLVARVILFTPFSLFGHFNFRWRTDGVIGITMWLKPLKCPLRKALSCAIYIITC